MTNHPHRSTDDSDPIFPEVKTAIDAALRQRRNAPTAQPAKRLRRPVLIAASFALTAAAIAIILSVVLAASPSGGPVDVLGRAQAALTQNSELAHYTVRVRMGRKVTGEGPDLAVARSGSRSDCSRPLDHEVWQTAQPNRWRARAQGCSFRPSRNGPEITTSESSWTPGISSNYEPRTRRLRILTGLSPTSSAGTVPLGISTIGPGDPLQIIRDLLVSGDVVQHGTRRRDGRQVLTLTAQRTETSHRTTWLTRYVYDVDPRTYEPVRVTIVKTGRPAGATNRCGPRCRYVARPIGQRMDFKTYERLPLTTKTKKLLTIDPPTGTRVSTETLTDAREEQKKRRRVEARAAGTRTTP